MSQNYGLGTISNKYYVKIADSNINIRCHIHVYNLFHKIVVRMSHQEGNLVSIFSLENELKFSDFMLLFNFSEISIKSYILRLGTYM